MNAAERRTYHFESCLGRGGFGEVYRARVSRPSGFEAHVAVKVLRPDVDPTSQAAQRLRDEARVLGLVRHRAIPLVHDLVVLDGRLALVVEYVEGEDLSRALRRDPPPPRALAEIGATIADALHAAWFARLPGGGVAHVVHRDLKPANVRLSRDGSVRLLDFGIAWTDAVARAAQTQTAALVGSPIYMAPERYDGAPPEPSQDVFALGALLFEGWAGERLFRDQTFHTLAGLSLARERFDGAVTARLQLLPDTLPEPARELVTSMLSWMPDERPGAEAVARALELLAPDLPGPGLGAWSRARAWSPEEARDGGWVGRTLTEEDTPGPVSAPMAGEPPPLAWRPSDVETRESFPSVSLEPITTTALAPARRSAAGLATVLGGFLLAGVVAGLTLLPPAPGPDHAEVQAPAWSAPRELPAEPAAPASEPVPEPSTATPTARPAAPVVPAAAPRFEDPPAAARRIRPEPSRGASAPPTDPLPVVAVDPAPSAAPPSPPVAPGALVEVHLLSEVADVLVETPTGLVALPARLAAGSYRLLVPDLAGRPQVAGAVRVPAEGRLAVRCAMGLCRASP